VEHLEEGPNPRGADDASGADDPPHRWTDAVLVAAMRRGERGAFHEFFARFAPLIMALARANRLPSTDLTERVTEFLDDAAMRLILASTSVPRTLAAYLAASFRKRVRNTARDQRCRETLRERYATDAGGGTERAVFNASSEDAIRTSFGPAWERVPLSPAVERLARAIEQGLSDDERLLLAWLGARVPQRQIAAWLGVSHGALRVRVTRLRARLRDAALRYAYRLDGADRRELDRFFRRIDIAAPAASAAPPSPATVSASPPAGKEHDP
jgi:RNA polymerase sigma factor (sigma-70 family)